MTPELRNIRRRLREHMKGLGVFPGDGDWALFDQANAVLCEIARRCEVGREQIGPNPHLCECGCGQPTKLAKMTSAQYGAVKGKPNRFIQGHSAAFAAAIPRKPQPYDEQKRRSAILSMGRREGECLIWTGSLNENGYGFTSWHARRYLVHRLSYEWAIGPIPCGVEPDHLCRNPACFEPTHLELVTHRENVLRGDTIAAANAAKTACPQGHPYTPDNTRVRRGSRECKTCKREQDRSRHARSREAA